MYFRCPACLSASWTDRVGSDEALVCNGCGAAHVARPRPDLGTTLRRQYGSVLKFSNAEGIDSPTAFSVLMGLMTLEQARDPAMPRAVAPIAVAPAPSHRPAPTPAALPRTAPARPPVVESSGLDIDPAFREAVEQGRLTVEEAVRRGNRTVYAAALRKRHALSEEVSLRVADNRTCLFEAIRRLEEADVAAQRSEPFAGPRASKGHKAALLALAATIVTVVAWNTWSATQGAGSPPAPTPPQAAAARSPSGAADREPDRADWMERRLLEATDLRRADDGTLVEVSGPDPRTVLIAYCRAMAPLRQLEPLRIGKTATGSRDSRLGHYRDLQALGRNFAIRMHRDWKSRRWVAGIGTGPIPATEGSPPAEDSGVAVASSN